MAQWHRVGGTGGTYSSGSTTINPVPDVTGLACGTVTEQKRGRLDQAILPITFNAPNPLGTAPAKFAGVAIYKDDGESNIPLGRFDFSGSAGDPVAITAVAEWPPNNQTWIIRAVPYGTDQGENPITNTTPSVTVTVQVSIPPTSAGSVGLVTGVGATALTLVSVSEHGISVPYAATTVTATAPATLGTGDATFSAVEIFVDKNTETISVGIFPYSGIGGGTISCSVRSRVLFPQSTDTWTVYVVSRGPGAVSNPLVKSAADGSTITPHTTLSVSPITGSPAVQGPPPDVTITNIEAQLLTQSRYKNTYHITVTYTVPLSGPRGYWPGVGVHGYYELPDQSANVLQLDGSTPLNGVVAPAGNWVPVDAGKQFYVLGAINTFEFNIPAPAADSVLRVRLLGYTYAIDPTVTQNSPSITITLKGVKPDQSGTSQTSNVTGFNASSYYQINGQGTWSLNIDYSLNLPIDDSNFGGYGIFIIRPVTNSTTTIRRGASPVQYKTVSLTGVISNASNQNSGTIHVPDLPSSTEIDTLYVLSYDVNGQPNNYVPNVTPSILIELDIPPSGGSGTEKTLGIASNVSATISVFKNTDGVQDFKITAFYAPPDITVYPEYAGIMFVLRNISTQQDQVLGYSSATDVTWNSRPIPIDNTLPTYDLYFVSYTKGLGDNRLVPGITPRVQSLHPTPLTGSLDPTRLDTTKLNSTVGTSSGRFGVLPGGVSNNELSASAVQIQNFASSVRPVALITADPALPSSNYPSGAVTFNVVTRAWKRVNTAGTGWESFVAGPDIAATSITAGQLQAGAVAAAFVNGDVITANISITAPAISGGTITGSVVSLTAVSGVQTKTLVLDPGAFFTSNNGPIKLNNHNSTSGSDVTLVLDPVLSTFSTSSSGAQTTLQNGHMMMFDGGTGQMDLAPTSLNITNGSSNGALDSGKIQLSAAGGISNAFTIDVNSTYTATTASAGAITPPAAYAAYLIVKVANGTYKIPLYNN